MDLITGVGLGVVLLIGCGVLLWALRTVWAVIGNIVAGAVALFVASVVGIQVPITSLTILAVILTGLPGALIFIVLSVYDPTVITTISEEFARLITF